MMMMMNRKKRILDLASAYEEKGEIIITLKRKNLIH